MAKTASNQLGICPWKMHVRPIPKVSIFMAVTTKKVMEKAQKWAKMARFWPKTRHNGRVMARKIFFHQCLWVTKFCAKFGRSWIPRTARVHNSFIILRCVWKEPVPLCFVTLKQIWKVLSSFGFGLVILLLTFGEALHTSFDFHIFSLEQSSNMTLSIYSRI